MRYFYKVVLYLFFITKSILSSAVAEHTGEIEDSKFWMKSGKDGILESLNNVKIEKIAKNLILFVGDGMGMASITAGRIYKGQLENKSGEEGYLSFEKFKNVGLLKTYNVDRQVPDSAGTATALFSGIKGNYYTVGLDSTGPFNVCRTDVEEKAKVKTLMDWGIEAGKHTGLVTTTRISHATPAAAYSHSPHRDWECDTKIPESESKLGCRDISRQLIEDDPGRKINVILGGGEQTLRKIERNSTTCTRNDDKNLIEEWQMYHREKKSQFIKTKSELSSVHDVDYLLGIFAPDHLPYDKDREAEHPSLEDMTMKAIELLQKNPLGYVLIVEGGRIDHAHHDNLAKIALEEVVAFDKAIAKAVEMTSESDTIIAVTADHSHSMSMNGYPVRGNPIGGVGYVTPEGFAFQTLSYINGPAYNYHRTGPSSIPKNGPPLTNLTTTLKTWKNINETVDHTNRLEPHFAGFWMDYETHGGEDVPVYSRGPFSHLLHGVHEQTHVTHVLMYAGCLGPYSGESHCQPEVEPSTDSSGISFSRDSFKIQLAILIWFFGQHLG